MKTVHQLLAEVYGHQEIPEEWPPKIEESFKESTEAPEKAEILLHALMTGVHRYTALMEPLIQELNHHSDQLRRSDRAIFYHLKAYYLWKKNHDLVPAMQYLHKSLHLLSRSSDKAYASRVHDTIGQILYQLSSYADALREYELSLKYRAAADKEGKAITYGNLARLYMLRGNYPKALEYFKLDMELLSALENTPAYILAQVHHSIAECNYFLNNPEYRDYLKNSMQLNEQHNNKTGLCFNTLLLAQAHLDDEASADFDCHINNVSEYIRDASVPSFLKNYLEIQYNWLKAKKMVLEGRKDEAETVFQHVLELRGQEKQFSLAYTARLLLDYAAIKKGAQKADLMKQALEALDGSDLEDLRRETEQKLRDTSYVHWLLHTTGRYLGHRQLDFLLNQNEGEFKGDLKDVVILFADIRGFTGVSEKLTASGLVELLNDFLAAMTSSIEYFGGYVDKFIGDAVMAVFSLPHPRKDDAARAVKAAMLMKESLERFNRYLSPDLPKLKIGIGLHSGEVVAGLIGSLQKRSYTVIGDAVNTASRLEGMTKQLGAGILVSENVATQLKKSDYILRPLGSYAPKGRGQSLAVYYLEGLDDGDASMMDFRKQIKQTENALKLFKERKFAEAADIFLELFEEFADEEKSVGYNLLYQNARNYSMNPPGYDWDGSIRLVNK